MATQRTRRAVLAAGGAAATAGLAGCTRVAGRGGGDAITVFHAGSLAPPFAAAEPRFEAETGVDVTREARGSVASTRKITDLGRTASVLGVSDVRLVRDMLLPAYGDWVAAFATNAMALQYRPGAPGAGEIARDNWWEVLSRDGVTVGHSDPAADPGGYRAVQTLQLGAREFEGSRLYDDATYRALRANSTVPTDTEARLTAPLEAGKLDYVIYYRSLAATSGLPWIDLQPEVDLSVATGRYARHYAGASVETATGTYVGAPIAYGLTVPDVAPAPEAGARWVEYFATEPGRRALRAAGLEPIDPVVVNEGGAVPDRVLAHAEPRAALGPLSLSG